MDLNKSLPTKIALVMEEEKWDQEEEQIKDDFITPKKKQTAKKNGKEQVAETISLLGIGRDNEGDVQFFFAENLGITTNNFAEVKAVHKGMQQALKIGWQKIQIELDSQIIMNLLSDYRTDSSPNWRIAKEVWGPEFERFRSDSYSLPSSTMDEAGFSQQVSFYHRKPAWLPSDSIYAVASALDYGINILDFSLGSKSPCSVDND
ncbi:hypothetical protein KI387_013754, partial [Taxus chinensis]